MSILAKMFIDDREINLLNVSFSFEQKADYNGRPSSKPTGGTFKIVFETTKGELFFLWMINNTMKNVKIVFSPTAMNGKSRIIELYDVFCLLHIENFDGVNNQPMSTYIEISPAIMIDSGVKIFEKYWKETDLSMENVVPTVINEQEEDGIIKKITYFNKDENEIIEHEIGKNYQIQITTENLEGENISLQINHSSEDGNKEIREIQLIGQSVIKVLYDSENDKFIQQ